MGFRGGVDGVVDDVDEGLLGLKGVHSNRRHGSRIETHRYSVRPCVILGQRHYLPRQGADIGRSRPEGAARDEVPQTFEDVLRPPQLLR